MSLPNFRLKVADKEVFWDTIKNENGWKLQCNAVSKHYRVVNPEKYREAWGTDRETLLKEFYKLSASPELLNIDNKENINEKPQVLSRKQISTELYDELSKLSNLYAEGIIEIDFYESERNKIQNKISTLP